MGYETFFNLNVAEGGPGFDDVASVLCDISGDTERSYWKSVLQGDDPSRWYDYTPLMAKVSLRYPGVRGPAAWPTCYQGCPESSKCCHNSNGQGSEGGYGVPG